MAKFCFELHSIKIDNFDFLKKKKFNLEGYDISKNVSQLKEILGDDFDGDNVNEKMDFLYETHNSFDIKDNVLYHGDLHEENI